MSAQKMSGLARKMIEFLAANPEEHLTREDIAVKWDVPATRVHTQLAQAIDAGPLVREESLDGELLYRLGEGAPTARPAPASHPLLGAMAPQAKARRAPLELDVDAIEIRRGVPLPGHRSGLGQRLIDKMGQLQVGESFLVPSRAKGTLAKSLNAAQKSSERRFASRRVGDEIGVWRVA